MTLDEYRAELANLEYMRDNTTCEDCRNRLLKRIYVTRAAIINLAKREVLLTDLESRGIAVEIVKRFKVKKSIKPNNKAVKAIVKVDA
ncbi:hypothetical protein [Metasolibacillus sp.]|uniref:hypothetical protein n=1 Tax=Metasolibacillus sp. TaxID=2703680 RepID=UPI0025EBABC5|nr:hypothetical protein [Metasolibacillus sp.]MCT6925281.1 hypothetical protein [Metasolibacillus sp.]MCT6941489.1 hypothetical protein [Metasolibacillus sp.]